ncbi:MAG TPA: T9SS type A sorting domain-containing protein [Bacteroidia bacterium]|jgi:hypothetical protein
MKKKLLNCFLVVFSAAFSQVSAQTEGTKIHFNSSMSQHFNRSQASSAGTERTAACGTDTILYPYLKELVIPSADSFFIDAMVGSVRTASQAYLNSSPVNVVGLQFWGYAYSTAPNFAQVLPVKAYLYSVDAFNMPVSVIDSGIVNVTGTENFYSATFTNPHVVSGNFAVAVRSNINDTLAVVTNNAGTPTQTPDYSESLGWRRFGSGTWNTTLSFFGQDLEYMIFPIVNYSLTSTFTASDNNVCAGTTVNFTNTSPSAALLSNRAFNLLAFDDYWGGLSDSSVTWNFGDSPAWTTAMNASHTYNTPGTYTARLASEMAGYYTTCTDTASAMIMVNPVYNTTSSAAICTGETYSFGTQSPGTAGTYTETFQSISGCDSTVILTLSENPVYNNTVAATICNGSNYTFGTQTLSTPGTYNETFQSVSGCDSIVALTLTVNTVDTSVTVSSASIMANATGASFMWIDCNNSNSPIAGETSDTFSPMTDGDYAVVVTQGSCSDTSACINFLISGINVLSDKFNVSVFPNPFTEQVTINSGNTVPQQIIITNILGEVVMNIRPSSFSTTVNTSSLADAVYFVNIINGQYSKALKISKK